MGDKKIPYLCGGTLFFLLVQTKKPRTNAREREKGIKDHLTDPEMMEGLIHAITGHCTHANGGSLKKDTSRFRECQINGSASIPINDQAVVSSFDYDIKNNYNIALLRMMKFAEDFLNPQKAAWLVRVLLDVIEQDSGIEEETPLYIQQNGESIPKSELHKVAPIKFQPFLTGVLHYILKYRPDNISGQPTLDILGVKESGNERRLRDDLLLGSHRTVDVDWCALTEYDALSEDPTIDEEQNDEPEYAEAEIVDECSPKTETKTTNQSIFINSGSGVQIGVNYGTINLSPRQNTKDD